MSLSPVYHANRLARNQLQERTFFWNEGKSVILKTKKGIISDGSLYQGEFTWSVCHV